MGIKIGESKVKCMAICKYTVQQASDCKINELYQMNQLNELNVIDLTLNDALFKFNHVQP